MAKRHDTGGSTKSRLLVEVEPTTPSGDLAPRITAPEDFRRRAREVADSVAEVAEEFQSRFEQMIEDRTAGLHLNAVEIEFSITLQAETGVVIAKAKAGTTFTARISLGLSENP